VSVPVDKLKSPWLEPELLSESLRGDRAVGCRHGKAG